jgi:hypothetical protein
LLEPYNLPKFPVYHFDLYRFSSSDQWFDAGFDDVLAGPGLILIEWPEKAAGALAAPDLLLVMVADATTVASASDPMGDSDLPDSGMPTEQRRLRGRALSAGARRCLNRMTHAAFISPPSMTPGAAGAS